MSDPVSEIFQSIKEGWEEAKAEQAKRNVLLSYWCKLFENFNYSPKQFYKLVEGSLQQREVPSLETYHLVLHQGGVFSPRRLYLQLRRERLVFEICAAPFGTGFFVSSRLFDRRRNINLLHILLALSFLGFCGFAVWINYGLTWAIIAVSGIMALVWSLMRLAAADLAVSLDRTLPELPVIGPMYDYFFHPDTYYRQDLSSSYRDAVHNAVMEAIDGMTSAQGIKPLSADERRPILRDLHRK
jgi:hypothetical protein